MPLSPTTETERERRRESNPLHHHNDPSDCLLCLGFLDNRLPGRAPPPPPPRPPKQRVLTSALRTLSRNPGNPTQSLHLPLPSPPKPVDHKSLWQAQCPLSPQLHPPTPGHPTVWASCPQALCLAQTLSLTFLYLSPQPWGSTGSSFGN